jgi:hypothetical protein
MKWKLLLLCAAIVLLFTVCYTTTYAQEVGQSAPSLGGCWPFLAIGVLALLALVALLNSSPDRPT